MDKIRIATVRATGKRYVVSQLDFRANKAHCWGEVTEVCQNGRALQTRHDAQKTFVLDAVTIAEVDRTPELLRSLFDQRIEGLRAQGHVVDDRTTRRGNRRVTDHGTPAQMEARRAANERILADIGPLLDAVAGVRDRARARGGIDRPYAAPAVTQGPDMPIPEARPDVLEKIVDRVTAEGAFLQRYSNGELTVSSLAVGLTFEACKGVPVLEAPGHTVHYDKALGLYWRRAGSWD